MTQNGSSITGTLIDTPLVTSQISATTSGTVSGTLTGTSVTLSMPSTVTVSGKGELAGFTMSCSSTDTFTGQATNTSIVGTFTAGIFTCGGSGVTLPGIDTKVTGPMTLTKLS